jgi:hypothetical protein
MSTTPLLFPDLAAGDERAQNSGTIRFIDGFFGQSHRSHQAWRKPDELGSHRRKLARVQRQGAAAMGQADLDIIKGRRTELAGRLQRRYGYAKDEAESEIDSWLNSVH